MSAGAVRSFSEPPPLPWRPVLVLMLAGGLLAAFGYVGVSALTGSSSEPETPRTQQPVAGPRSCWDGSQLTPPRQCRVPTGERGLEAVSPAFVEARRNGDCESSFDQPASLGYLCTIDGAVLRFSWFPSGEELRAQNEAVYPDCRPVRYLEVCEGPDRIAVRYADPDFVVQVTSLQEDSEVLLGVPMNPSERLLAGTEVS